MRFLLSVLILLCTSCIQIGSSPQPMRYYLLESMPETTKALSDKTLDIEIKLIKFPNYLDRPQIVTHNQTNAISFDDGERWAEPLQESLMQVLRENLVLLLPAADISVSPWEHSSSDPLVVSLIVNKFSGRISEHTEADIRWSISRDRQKTTRGHFTDRQPIGIGYRDLVTGLNKGLESLSHVLAEKLAEE